MRPGFPSPRCAPRALAAIAAATLSLGACTSSSMPTPLARAIAARDIRAEVEHAYDFTRPNVPANLLALYASDRAIASASGGRITTSRDTIRMQLDTFWTYVGRNMQSPHIEFTRFDVDLLSPTTASMIAVYRIPHHQPNGLPHVVGGAWTAIWKKTPQGWRIVQEHLSDDPLAH